MGAEAGAWRGGFRSHLLQDHLVNISNFQAGVLHSKTIPDACFGFNLGNSRVGKLRIPLLSGAGLCQ